MAATMHYVLNTLHRAGGRDVQARDLPWVVDDFPAVNRAITMQYVMRYGDGDRSTFSLTHSGYHAIDQEPPPMTAFEILKKAALIFFFGRPY